MEKPYRNLKKIKNGAPGPSNRYVKSPGGSDADFSSTTDPPRLFYVIRGCTFFILNPKVGVYLNLLIDNFVLYTYG